QTGNGGTLQARRHRPSPDTTLLGYIFSSLLGRFRASSTPESAKAVFRKTPIIWRSRDEDGARPAQAPSPNWKTYYAQCPTQPKKLHRSAVENHVHRPPRLGSRRSLNLRIGIITGTQGGLITSAGLAVR